MRKRRGNLLISALFMAAFLFFLSVALVVTNREDIRYTLFVDHTMRAQAAADGMLDYGLQVMRSQPQWEAMVQSAPPPFSSGATARLEWRPWVSPSSFGPRYAPPGASTTRLPALQLTAVGQSGPFVARRQLVVEEFRLADSLLQGSLKPHLFALVGDQLHILPPNFKWESGGAIPHQGPLVPRSFSAGGSLLRVCAKEEGTEPPEIQDFQPVTLPSGLRVAGAFGPVAGMSIPLGQGAKKLEIESDKLSWKLLPDPGDQLGGVAQAKVEADASQAGVLPGESLNWDILAPSTSDLTVDYSFFSGPRLNWYAITGACAQAQGDRYICHGTHYFYSGFKFKNSDSPGGMIRSQGKDAQLFEQPCILQLQGEKWTVLLDYLKVTDLQSEPTVISGLQPDPNSMLVDSKGQVLVHALGSEPGKWFRVELERLSESNVQADFFYQDQGVALVPRTNLPFKASLLGLSRHDLSGFFPAFLPARNQSQPTGFALQPAQNPFAPEPRLDLYWNVKGPVASQGRDLYLAVQLMTRPEGSSQDPTGSPFVLAHFDGEVWQLLPGGLAPMLDSNSAYRRENRLFYEGSPGAMVASDQLTLGSYASSRPMLRRYVPVARF